MRTVSLFSGAFFGVAALLPSQGNVIVVDAAGGPGSQFTDLPQAIAAAASGDTLDVRAGDYSGFSTNKGLHIQGGPGVTISLQPNILQLFTVSIPAGERFTMRDVRLSAVRTLFPSGFTDCAGSVVLENVALSSQGSPLLVSRCASVEADQFVGRLTIIDSNVSLEDCALLGFSPNRFEQAPALIATRSNVVVSGSLVRGGVNVDLFSGPVPAIRLDASQLTLLGFDPTDAIYAGTSRPSAQVPTSAVTGTGSVLVDSNLIVMGIYGAPPFASGLAVTTTDLPALRTTGGLVGGVVQIELRAPPSESYFLAIGFPTAPVAVPGLLGDFWLDGAQLMSVGGTGATGQVLTSLQTVNDPVFLGLHLGWQAVTTFASEAPRFSNLAMVSIRP